MTGSLMVANAMASRGEDIRLYHFTQKPAGKAGEEFGASHGWELPYVFGPGAARPSVPISNYELADQMSESHNYISPSFCCLLSNKAFD